MNCEKTICSSPILTGKCLRLKRFNNFENLPPTASSRNKLNGNSAFCQSPSQCCCYGGARGGRAPPSDCLCSPISVFSEYGFGTPRSNKATDNKGKKIITFKLNSRLKFSRFFAKLLATNRCA